MGLRLTKVAAPSSPAANTCDFYYDTTLAKLSAIDESGNVAQIAGFATKDFRLIRILNYTSGNNTYTATTGTKAIFVECWGGGGGGCSVANGANASNAACSVGGGGGSYAAAWLTGTLPSAGTTYDANVGAAATGGAAGANNGTAGNDTTFRETTGPTNKCIGKGGGAGLTANATASSTTAIFSGIGGVGGIAGTGDLTIVGEASNAAIRLSGTMASGSQGGAAPRGGSGGLPGQIVAASTAQVGSNGVAPGGGGGGMAVNNATSLAGGNGAAGAIRIWEFA